MVKAERNSRLSAEDRRVLLEDAAIACMARGGIRAFTVDRIVTEAGVSRGLITHHFGSMDGLLVAVYARMYRQWIEVMARPHPGLLQIEAVIEALISDELFSRDVLNVWLTLWGEVSNNPSLRGEHRNQYAAYRANIAEAIQEVADQRGLTVDAIALSGGFICLVDGLGVQRCIEPALMTTNDARDACLRYLEPHLGPLTGHKSG
jgi:TetR/AcrR family transcriptional repressor of bet genes